MAADEDKNHFPKYMSITGQPLDLDFRKTFLGNCRHIREFSQLNQLGEGTYGVVHRAEDTLKKSQDKHSIVALKQVRIFDNERMNGIPITALREISLLRSLKHQNVVNVLDVAVGDALDDVYMVMEYAEQDLANLLDHARVTYSQSEVKCLSKQLFEGLEYLHRKDIIHRDIKMSNLLLTAKGTLKIADFGMARVYSKRPLTPQVVTVWYRSPELLFGATMYTPAVDLWSAGMVIGELFLQHPLCPGDNEIDQVHKITNLLGSPTDRIWPGMRTLPDFKHYTVPVHQRSNKLESMFLNMSTKATVELLNACLTYDPDKRISAKQALNHAYFRESPLPKEPAMLPTFPEIRNESSSSSVKDSATTSNQMEALALHSKRPGVYGSGSSKINPDYIFDFDGEFGGLPFKKRSRGV